MRIRLSDEDREHYGCPEWIDCDIEKLSVAEAEAIEEAGGEYSWFLSGIGAKTARARVFIGLLRAGVVVNKLTDIEVNLAGLTTEASPGKAPSARSAMPTSSTSARSGRRTRSKTS